MKFEKNPKYNTLALFALIVVGGCGTGVAPCASKASSGSSICAIVLSSSRTAAWWE